jgi:hypothetical protein
MANFTRNFLAGRMNKIVDERVLPEGEYVDAMNIRMGSTEISEVGVIENTKGNLPLTSLAYLDGTPLSVNARCIGAIEDSANETIYWFVHDPEFTVGATGKLDLIVSFNVLTNILTYHIISIDDGGGENTTLNFNPLYLITGVNIIENLLFWTDNYNPPRFINIRPTNNRYPNPLTNIDLLDPEAILVIKKPPHKSPTVLPIITSGQENFLKTRFISFAYRYKYVDGEYSATSQWSDIAFVPNQFEFSTNSVLNEGMTNFANAANITYNSGGPLVVGIDLLFKQSENNIIKVIQKIDKAEQGLSNNTEYSFTFNNSKIFTVLNEAEVLRLYDNVPLLAKAQTIMGNRLMYGNYIEGFDLIDKLNQPVRFDYVATLLSEEIGLKNVPDTTANGYYNIDPSNINTEVFDSIVYIDLNGIDLTEGSSVSFELLINHSLFTGLYPFPTETNTNIELNFTFILPTTYGSVYEMASSDIFKESIGTALNINPVYSPDPNVSTSCDGSTLTDNFNCLLGQVLGTYEKYASGIDAASQPIKIITTPASTQIGFQLTAMEYVNDVTNPTEKIFEYYAVTQADASYQKISSPSSLHSNRGYEVGIVYMDEFGRSTTSLVSPDNAVYVPCSASSNRNSIIVTIPYSQRAPYWAKKYKFVIKPDADKYETIYSNLFFQDPETNSAWLLMEGENMRKVENGDRLNVKTDTRGIVESCIQTTVLDKVAQMEDFINVPNPAYPGQNLKIPAGLYIKVNPNNFSLEIGQDTIIAPGLRSEYAQGGRHAYLPYPMNEPIEADPLGPNPTWTFADYNVPAGSTIQWNVSWSRRGVGGKCQRTGYNLVKRYTSSRDYDNMYDWFIGDNISSTINTGVSFDDVSNKFLKGTDIPIKYNYSGTVTAVATNKLICATANFSEEIMVGNVVRRVVGNLIITARVVSVDSPSEITLDENIFTAIGQEFLLKFYPSDSINYWKFYRNPVTNELTITFSTTNSCTGSNYKNSRRINVNANIQVYRAENLICFETEPTDALPNVFFENNLCFDIDEDGNHMGNIQDQDISTETEAIIDTKFFNCFSFGNGVESYKIRDSILGASFNFGERVTTVAAQDYKMSDRFSDITYSGIFNGESNINKLNEFNSGLSNFKHCEASFGEIQLLDGRNTDILVLQEDKISYVLGEKNLLSDASAGGVITASPMVLGTQIARTEKYGISFNPESYVQWGSDRFFTDAKRGSVIQLKGGDSQSEQLAVISNQNMRTWFRDVFNNTFNNQKLGGFDPYMNEYVLSINEESLPINQQCLSCGVVQTFTLSVSAPDTVKEISYCVDLGSAVGLSYIRWELISIEEDAELTIDAQYNGDIVTSGPVITNGEISFNKDIVSEEVVYITLTYTGDMIVNIFADCPVKEEMTIIEVVLTNNSEAGKTIHTQYRYSQGIFLGPLFSNLVLFTTGDGIPLVSRYNLITGIVGTGGFPPESSFMRMLTNKIAPDNYDFNPAQNKFRYLRGDVLYENNDSDIQTMLFESTIISPIESALPSYYGDFIVPSSSLGQYLYLIWDLRNAIELELCYNELSNDCCDCALDNYWLDGSFTSATSIYEDSNFVQIADNGFYSFDGIVRELVDGVLLPAQTCSPCSVEVSLCFGDTLLDVCCNCETECPTPYNSYLVDNANAFGVLVGFHNQSGIYQEVVVPANAEGVEVCSVGYPTCSVSNVTITFNNCFCSIACDSPTIVVGAGGYGLYKVDVNVGTDTGAIVLGFDVAAVPDGIRVTYDGVVYNKISSPINGVAQSPNVGSFTVVGNIASDCGLDGNTVTNNYPIYIWNQDESVFVPTGDDQTITTVASDVILTSLNPFNSIMVIPKPNQYPNIVSVEILGPCENTGWDFDANCPASLEIYSISVVYPTSAIPCSADTNQAAYLAKVSNAIYGTVGLYDYLFEDVNGETPLADGFYLVEFYFALGVKVIRIQDGVIIAITNCV